MAHFAEIDENNIVTRVLVVDNENENNGHVFLSETCGLGGTWIQTSYNTKGGVHSTGGIPLRKNYAGIGYTYDSVRDAFIPPMPSTLILDENGLEKEVSWTLNEDTCLWEIISE
jgi:hypothetical protein